jgi:hypothetical protein
MQMYLGQEILALENILVYIYVHQLNGSSQILHETPFRKAKKAPGKQGRITGVKAMGGHLYWHECRVETILRD